MRIAPYYQKLLQEAVQVAKGMEPITFAGMFDSGVDYLFNLTIPLLATELEKETVPVAVDLSGLTTKEEIETELSFALSDVTPHASGPRDYFTITAQVRQLCATKKLVFVAYLGQDGGTDPQFFQFLGRLRNLLGWRFSYVLFVTTRLLFDPNYQRPLFDKVLKRNLVTVLPLDEENSDIVLANYEERYKKTLSQALRHHVLELAGGNPGLVKALYLQVSTTPSWKTPDILDERLYFRLEGIARDVHERAHDKQPLRRFGYFVPNKSSSRWFSPLLSDFLKIYPTQGPKPKEPPLASDGKLLHLTKSQRTLLAYLEGRSGELVTKDDIAKVLWGEAWADRYSDWAIDQLISTLREKLATIKHDGKIVTKKGEGIIFLQNE